MSSRSPYGNYAYAMLTANARRTPDKVALVCRGRSHTFDGLNREVNKLANALTAAGVTAGQRVGSLLSDLFTMVMLPIPVLGTVLLYFDVRRKRDNFTNDNLRTDLDALKSA